MPPYDVVCDSADRAGWLEARQTGIGASEIAAVLGESEYMSAIELYWRKISDDVGDKYGDDPPEWIEFGHRLEDFIAGIFAERTGYEIRKAGHLLRSKEWPWMLATLDYECLVDGEWYPLEIKNVSAYRLADWQDGAPPHYAWQGQQQMLVVRKDRLFFGGFVGGNRFIWDEMHDTAVARRRVLRDGNAFWHCVQQRRPPAPDGSESADRAVRALAGDAAANVAELEGNFVATYDEIKQLEKTKKETERRLKEIKQGVRLRLGSDTHGLLPDGRSFSCKEVNVAGRHVEAHDIEPYSYRRLLLHKAKARK